MIVKKLLIICVTFALLSCNNDPAGPISGDGTHTGNALVTGYLYSLNNEPANGAKVYFVKVNYNPHSHSLEKTAAIADTVLTNNAGQYSTNDLDTGTYNVYGVGLDGSMSLLNAVSISGVPQTLPSDTLKMPGSLSGFIKMQGADDPRTVFVIPLGTNGFTNANINKGFNLTNLAEGSYSVRFLSTLDRYVPLDTVFTVTASSSITLQDSIVLPLRIPTPTKFSLSYDSLRQMVTLAWSRIDSTSVKGYNIYRKHIDSTYVKLNTQIKTDTFCIDSTGIQDQTYTYKIVAIDAEDKEGIGLVSNNITFTSIISARAFGNSGVEQGSLLNPYRLAIEPDGNICVVDSFYRRVQLFDTNGTYIKRPNIFSVSGIVGIEVNGAGDRFVAYSSKIIKFSSLDSVVLTIDTLIDNVTDIAVDINGAVYIVGQDVSEGGSIWKFDSIGKYITRWQTGAHYQSIYIGSDSKVYVGGDKVVNIYEPNGTLIKVIMIDLNVGGQSLSSRSIRDIVVTQTSKIIVTDLESDELFLLEKNGNVLTRGGHFSNLTGLALSNNKTLYGVEFDANKILQIRYY